MALSHGLGPSRKALLLAIVVLSLALNVAGNEWGAPRQWHPDELTTRADALFGERSLNPHFFAYGGLGFYVFTAGAIAPVRLLERVFDPRPDEADVAGRRLWADRDASRVIRAARMVSALLGTLVVVITYVIGAALWNQRVGALAALLTAVAGSGVVVAHLATIDANANFWSWVAILATLGLWTYGRARWYVIAGLLVGIATGVKLDRGMMLVPLVAAHFLGRRRLALLLVAFAAIPVGFIAANPAFLVAPFEFLDGFTRDAFFQFVRPAYDNRSSSYLSFADYARVELGWPLAIGAVAAVLYWVREALLRDKHRETIWLCSTFVPYYAILGSKQLNSWYVHLVVPALMIFTAASFVRALSSENRALRAAALAMLLVVVGAAQLSSVGYILEFKRDARYEAAAWAAGNVPSEANVGTSIRGPYLPGRSEAPVEILPDDVSYAFAFDWQSRLEQNRAYAGVRQVIQHLEGWMGGPRRVARPRRPYQAWFDAVSQQYGEGAEATRATVRPDFVFLNQENAALVDRLRRDDLGYRLVAEMHPRPLHAKPVFAFLDERVYVFKRERDTALPLLVSDGTIR